MKCIINFEGNTYLKQNIDGTLGLAETEVDYDTKKDLFSLQNGEMVYATPVKVLPPNLVRYNFIEHGLTNLDDQAHFGIKMLNMMYQITFIFHQIHEEVKKTEGGGKEMFKKQKNMIALMKHDLDTWSRAMGLVDMVFNDRKKED